MTSVIVGSTAVGLAFGAPLAGYLSGKKIELGLVPVGGVAMTLLTLGAALALHHIITLVLCIAFIGFFTGFYLVPLYTLLQHRAPKSSKGDMVAVSNFVNVTGAILASVTFFLLVTAFQQMGVAKPIAFTDAAPAPLERLRTEDGVPVSFRAGKYNIDKDHHRHAIRTADGLPEHFDPSDDGAPDVIVGYAKVYGVDYYYLKRTDVEAPPIYDNSALPGFLFAGGSLITLVTLLLLGLVLPDMFRRGMWVLRTLGRPRLEASGTAHVPLTGAALVATDCPDRRACRDVRSATDRPIDFLQPNASAARLELAGKELRGGGLVGLTAGAGALIPKLREMAGSVPVLPVHYEWGPSGPSVQFGTLRPSSNGVGDLDQAVKDARNVDDADEMKN